MKNVKGLVLSAAVILGAGGMILGNHVLASNALAESGGAPEQAIVMPESAPVSAMGIADVELRSNADGVVYLAAADDVQKKVDLQAADKTNPSSISANNEAAGNTAPTRNEDVPRSEEPQTTGEANRSPDAEGRKATMVVAGSEEDPCKEGTPLETELSSDEAREVAIKAIVDKYALTQDTLKKFNVTAKYFVEHPNAPGKHTWQVSLDPVNTNDFTEIGCYWTYLDAETGDILQMNSAANGKG